MNQCVKEVVAFGLNPVELDLVVFSIIVVLSIIVGRWLLVYLNSSRNTEEEK